MRYTRKAESHSVPLATGGIDILMSGIWLAKNSLPSGQVLWKNFLPSLQLENVLRKYAGKKLRLVLE